jgi:hypothetical protein
MNDEDLPSLYKLLPNISILEVNCKNSKFDFETASKFQELETLILYSEFIQLSPLMEFLKISNSKLKKLFLPNFEKTHQEEILEFYEILTKKNLTNFGISFGSEFEVKLFSNWVEKNSNLNRLMIGNI